MAFKIIKNLKEIDLRKERLRSFKYVVLSELLIIFLADTLQLFNVENYVAICEIVFPLAISAAVILMWDMLRIYSKSKALVIILFTSMVSMFFANLILLNPFHPLLVGRSYDIFGFVLMLFFVIIEVVIIRYTIVEIFKRYLPTNENLWGAV